MTAMALGAVLPFSQEAAITDRSGLVLAWTRARIWPRGSSTEDVGQAYEYGGVAAADSRETLVEHRNRQLRVTEGETYRVVRATWHPTLGYVELALRRVKGDG